jgi:hypothetical protein
MKFRPLHDRVVVTRIDAEGKTAGGIIIPDTAKEKPCMGPSESRIIFAAFVTFLIPQFLCHAPSFPGCALIGPSYGSTLVVVG